MKLVDYISEFLARKEVTRAFGVSGANIEDLFESIHKLEKTKIILAKSEYSAATMALGSYLTSKKISTVVLTTSGPGVLNTLPILAEGFVSRIPLVLIGGSVPRSLEGNGAFQDTSGKGESFDVLKMLEQCTCYQIKVDTEDEIGVALERAFAMAQTHKRPAVVLVPKDLYQKEISPSFEEKFDETLSEFLPDLNEAQCFCEEFCREENIPPLVVLGEELMHIKDISPFLNFIFKTGAGVALTPNTKGFFDHNSRQYLGLIGIMGHTKVNEFLDKTKHLILIGVNFDLLNRIGLSEHLSSKKILIIKENKSADLFRVPSDSICEVYGPIDQIVSHLSSTLLNIKNFFEKECNFCDPGDGDSLKNMIAEIENQLPDEANIFVDAGNTGAFVIHHLKTSGKGVFYVSLGMGGMGNSIGAGIGGAAVNDKRSYVFLGDGSFLMYGLEIHTAVQYNLPVTFFVLNNNAHGMCATRENLFLDGSTGINDFKKSYFASGLEKMFPGLVTHEVNSLEELRESFEKINAEKNPSVISLNIHNTDDPPFRTFIKT